MSCPVLIVCGEKDDANKKLQKKLYKNNQRAGGLIARLPAFIL